MTIAIVKTKAEQQLAENFETVFGSLPGGGWMPEVRKAAFSAFATSGLPHRRVEEWKYTDLRTWMSEVPTPAANESGNVALEELGKVLGPDLAGLDCYRLVFVDGSYAQTLSEPGLGEKEGVHCGTLAEALGSPDHDWIKSHLYDEGNDGSDAILSLNTSFVSDGVLLHIDDNVKLSKPLHLVFVTSAGQPRQVAVRNLIKIGDGATVDIVESYVSLGAGGTSLAVTQLEVGRGADVRHTKDLREGSRALHMGKWQITLADHAVYHAFQMTMGTKLARNEFAIVFRGENSTVDLSGTVLARGSEHVDTTLFVDHGVPACESRELFKYVLDDGARGVFQGKVLVRQVAQKTDGKQMAQSLMLSENCEFDSKPELEIYADDVVCGHGSTSAELDKDLMFYLKARGIPPDEARSLLIQSFVGDAVEKVQHKGLQGALKGLAQRWLSE